MSDTPTSEYETTTRKRAVSPHIRRVAAMVLLAFTLSACTIVPGIRMDPDPDPRFVPEDGDPDDFAVTIHPIDANLLAEQRLRRQAQQNSERQSRRDLVNDYQYRIGVGDVLLPVIWEHPEINNPFGQFQNLEQQGRLVREDGTIFFPYIGTMDVEGSTVREVRDQIAEQITPYVPEPQVDLRVVAFRSQKVYVTGEVREPGALPLTNEPLTALDAINAAGGLAETADRRRLEIQRDDERIVLDALELYARGLGDVLLQDRDVLYVPDNQFNRVFVMGETERQMSVPLHDGRLTLAEAISEVDGLDLGTANTEEIYVLRGESVYDQAGELQGVRPDVFHLNARSGTALLLAEGFDLQPRDIVYVSSTGMVRFNRVIQQILPTIQTLWQTDRIIRD